MALSTDRRLIEAGNNQKYSKCYAYVLYFISPVRKSSTPCIYDLRLPEGFHMWKFADDTTVSEVVPPSKHSTLQQAVDFIHDWSQQNHLQLNPIRCKEIRTCFKRTTPCFSQVAIEGVEFEIVSSAKVLGFVISSNLKWSAHIDSIMTKAAKRLIST